LTVSQEQDPRPPAQPGATHGDAVALISAYGAFRLLIILLAIWSFVEGFALFTGRVDALTLGGNSYSEGVAEQVIGAHMIVLVPLYVLLAWQRDRYRTLLWVPYASQLAIILPLALSALRGHSGGIALLIVSVIFFSLLVYLWWQSHPLDFFQKQHPDGADAPDEQDDEGGATDTELDSESHDASVRRRYRRK
jgi:hypothetical protein